MPDKSFPAQHPHASPVGTSGASSSHPAAHPSSHHDQQSSRHAASSKKDGKEAKGQKEKTNVVAPAASSVASTGSTPSAPAVASTPRRKKHIGRWIAIIIGILLLLAIALGYVILRTTWIYDWAPFMQATSTWSSTLSEEQGRLSSNEQSLERITATPMTSGEIVIQQREIAEWSTRNEASMTSLSSLVKDPFVPASTSLPRTARAMGDHMRDYETRSLADVQAEADALKIMTLSTDLNAAIDLFLQEKSSDIFAGTDSDAIKAQIGVARQAINRVAETRDHVEQGVNMKLDAVHQWQDKQAEYLDNLNVFYDLRSAGLSTLKNQELLLRDIETAIAGMNPYTDLDQLDRTILTNARNTLRDTERRRRDERGEIMRRWRWWTIVRPVMLDQTAS